MYEPDRYLWAALARLDLTRADGRNGIRSLPAGIERRAPDAILQSPARVQRIPLDSDRR